MLEKIVHSLFVSASLLLSSGCVSFREYDVSKIESVVPVVRHAEAKLKDFGYLSSWEAAIEFVETPEQARWYCREMRRTKGFSSGLFLDSFRNAHFSSAIDCTEGAYAAAALLSDNGYPPLVLCLRTEMRGGEGHLVFLYKEDGKFGSIGLWAADSLLPEYDSVHDLARGIMRSMTSTYADAPFFKYYSVSNLVECDVDFVERRTPRLSIFNCQNEIK